MPRQAEAHSSVSPSSSKSSQGGQCDQEGKTELEKHAAFFDRNGDGVIYPWETYQGFRALGIGRLGSALAGVFVNIGVSRKTRPGRRFSPLFPIEVKNSHLAIHGSDTDVYDKNGRFVESNFEEIFKKHAHTHKDALNSNELQQMLKSNREPRDFEGWISSWGEWKLLHHLTKDKNGLLTKDAVRGVFDGSTFHQLEKQLASRDKMKN